MLEKAVEEGPPPPSPEPPRIKDIDGEVDYLVSLSASASAPTSATASQSTSPAPPHRMARRPSHVVIRGKEKSGFGLPLSEVVEMTREAEQRRKSMEKKAGDSHGALYDPFQPILATSPTSLTQELKMARAEIIRLMGTQTLPALSATATPYEMRLTSPTRSPLVSPRAVGDPKRKNLEEEWLRENAALLDYSEWLEPFGKKQIIAFGSDYKGETGHFNAGSSLPPLASIIEVSDDNDRPWLEELMKDSAKVSCAVGLVESGLNSSYVVTFVEQNIGGRGTKQRLRACLVSPDGLVRFCSDSKALFAEILKKQCGATVFHPVAAGFWQTSLTEAICKIQSEEQMLRYKIGAIRWLSGQTENEAMANPSSEDYEEFLAFLGTKVSLQNFNGYKGGLSEMTGSFSYYTKVDKKYEIMLHCPPFLPRGVKSDVQCLERKRFTGNDVVCIIFLEGDDAVFNPELVTSQFNHAWLVVRKVSVAGAPTRYKLAVVAKDTFRNPKPFIPNPAFAEKNEHLRKFILYKLINLERSALTHAPVFVSKKRRTRKIYIDSAVERCLAGWEPALDIKALPPGKIRAEDLKAGAQKLKRVRK